MIYMDKIDMDKYRPHPAQIAFFNQKPRNYSIIRGGCGHFGKTYSPPRKEKKKHAESSNHHNAV